MRRALAQIELYIFLAHGEQRDGIFNHGPYELDDGSVLVVKELTDLQNRFMPWVTEERRLTTPRVVLPMVLDGVDCTFDMFGTLYTDPEDYFDRVTGFEILAGDDLSPISEEQLGEIGMHAQRVQRDLFGEMARWDDDYKLLHAAYQSANVCHPFLEIAGCSDEEIRALLIEPFVRVAREHLEGAREDDMKIWTYVASGRDPLFPEVRA
jgi:hypothetical protein